MDDTIRRFWERLENRNGNFKLAFWEGDVESKSWLEDRGALSKASFSKCHKKSLFTSYTSYKKAPQFSLVIFKIFSVNIPRLIKN
jgi:hypothetical protein